MVTRIESAAGHDQDRARHAALLRSAGEQAEAEQTWRYLPRFGEEQLRSRMPEEVARNKR